MQTYAAWRATRDTLRTLGAAAAVILLAVAGFALARAFRLNQGAKAKAAFEDPDDTRGQSC